MKYSFCTAFTLLSLISCGNNDNMIEDPRPIDKELHSFEFKGYSVISTTSYKGSKGQKSAPDEAYLNNYWSLYKEPAWKKIDLDLHNNTIRLVAGTSADITYAIKMVNDSVLIDDKTIKPNYVGNYNKKESSFTLKRTFRYIKKASRETEGLLITQNTLFGTTQYDTIFGTVFTNPSQMTKSGDEVLWSNVDYYYQAP
ncbi:hypothetical protein [Chryseobacterium sp.]|uniref:hypothetical protein n=1 Tax=Chryseobacterium sp. TaxID=1871047 RepID=UPI0025B7B34F|nr:hypothetical protein [Chryseobacterium sp.]MBV8328718.1 hypothetical protein [Chryseobacterium sp.]